MGEEREVKKVFRMNCFVDQHFVNGKIFTNFMKIFRNFSKSFSKRNRSYDKNNSCFIQALFSESIYNEKKGMQRAV